MSFIIPKKDIPQEQYFPVKTETEVAMMTIIPTGPVILYDNEALFVPWLEIVEYAKTSDKKPLETPPEPIKEPNHESVRAGIREVKK